MNERIKELIAETGYILESDNEQTGMPVADEFVKKFAALIVRECAELTHWKDFDMSVEQRIRLSVYQDIKEHFGVEE